MSVIKFVILNKWYVLVSIVPSIVVMMIAAYITSYGKPSMNIFNPLVQLLTLASFVLIFG